MNLDVHGLQAFARIAELGSFQKAAQALHLSAWGGRRYALLLQLGPDGMRQWARGVETLCCAALRPPR